MRSDSLGEEIVSLLERMAANVSFALDNFDHEASRKSGERAMRRLNRMFGAISATNEAILRAKTEHDLYQRVCDAAVFSGKSFATVVLLAEPDTHWLEPVAGTGEAIDLITQTRFSTDPDNVYGKGICGEAFRTQRPCVEHDIPISTRPSRTPIRGSGLMACRAAADPIRPQHRRPDLLHRQFLGARSGDHRAAARVSPRTSRLRSTISAAPPRRPRPTRNASGCRGCSPH